MILLAVMYSDYHRGYYFGQWTSMGNFNAALAKDAVSYIANEIGENNIIAGIMQHILVNVVLAKMHVKISLINMLSTSAFGTERPS
ncbi:hypothetical protein N7V53_05790 [Kosakonia sp. HypNH10]|uniref:hypothetical protein n=1 Tax=Kosakonia sp. HypNH10 TaxID=2980101 RepID=UPI00244C75FB|nr:hypothetical protein [Kosakonia sp. HypNH10]MDH2912043.1 hypothetical protein [Kosakonia sp. HypNH10]